MSHDDDALAFHRRHRGKFEVRSKVPLANPADLALAYTPGVAAASRAIAADPSLVNTYTSRGNMVAVVSDGSAVLGLGNIGARAAMPVMEGKAIIFKTLAGIDAVPICLATQNADEIRTIVRNLAPTFAGINLEDIASPKCFELEALLQAECDIPIFHDDQHGTAVVVLAALENAARFTRRSLTDLRVVVSGAGAAGNACATILLDRGVADVTVLDSQGIISATRPNLPPHKQVLAARTNPRGLTGGIADVLRDADAVIGVSGAGLISTAMVRSMRPGAIVFALANPDPEILPADALAGGAAVVATGRSDMPNQINNMLGFPGIFRGALDVEATRITPGMRRVAAAAIAQRVTAAQIRRGIVVPAALDPTVVPAVALAVARQAMREGVARHPRTIADLKRGLSTIAAPRGGEGLS